MIASLLPLLSIAIPLGIIKGRPPDRGIEQVAGQADDAGGGRVTCHPLRGGGEKDMRPATMS